MDLNTIFSDNLKYMKLCMALILIFIMGRYYHYNSVSIVNTRMHTDYLFMNEKRFKLCGYYTKFKRVGTTLYISHTIGETTRIIEVRNIDAKYQNDTDSRFEIYGEIANQKSIEIKKYMNNPRDSIIFIGVVP